MARITLERRLESALKQIDRLERHRPICRNCRFFDANENSPWGYCCITLPPFIEAEVDDSRDVSATDWCSFISLKHAREYEF